MVRLCEFRLPTAREQDALYRAVRAGTKGHGRDVGKGAVISKGSGG